jgi:hypothetical protein
MPALDTTDIPDEPSTPTSTEHSAHEKPSVPVPADIESAKSGQVEWKPQKQEYLVMLTLSIISLMVALDATILVTVLPVSYMSIDLTSRRLTIGQDHSQRSPRLCHRCFLGRHFLPVGLCSLSAFHRSFVRHFRATRIASPILAILHHWVNSLRSCSKFCHSARWPLCSRNWRWWHYCWSSNHLRRYHSAAPEAQMVFICPHCVGDRHGPWSVHWRRPCEFQHYEILMLTISTDTGCRPRKQLGDGPSGSTCLSVVLELLR